MYLADYHTHTAFSPDGKYTMDELAERAVAIGLDELCFTDHIDPYYWKVFTPREEHPWQDMREAFKSTVERYGDRLKLRFGAEIGEAYWDFERAERIFSGAPDLDFLIGSVHMAARRCGAFDLYFIENRDEAYYHNVIDGYMEEMAVLAQWEKIDVLGHLTLPLRYINEHHGHHLTFERHMHQVEDVFRIIIPKGIGIECNTNRGNGCLPDPSILRLYREMGGEIITIGSDAHTADQIGCAASETQALLRECGFRYFTTFTRHKPEFHTL